jgi:hypothetical protein
MKTLTVYALGVLLCATCAWAQTTGSVEGQVTDKTGAVIPGANVVLKGAVEKSLTTNENGSYSFAGLTPGSYTVRITTAGFAPFERSVAVSAGQVAKIDAAMEVMLETQKVTVEGETQNTVTTDPSANAGALVIKGQDLEMLSDDPDELADDLQALAGPSAGPNGGQIFIDGFSNGRLPPKSAIREVRINQNPFAAEYDRLGFGRIEILTKPGSDKFHGQAMFNYSDDVLNSRNPFSPTKPPYSSKQFDVNVGGPLSKKASFFVDAERRNIDDNAVVNATFVDPTDFTISPLQESVVTPNNRTSVSPRIDYQLSPNNTLVGRYNFAQINFNGVGIGDFTLPERGYNTTMDENTVQLTETAVLNARAINETRFQYVHQNSSQVTPCPDGLQSIDCGVAINVLQSFNSGMPPLGVGSSDIENRWEINNTTSLVRGRHAIKFGGRVRIYDIQNTAPNNFNGTYTFGGGEGVLLNPDFTPILGPDGKQVIGQITSAERYQRTLYFQSIGYTPEQIRALSGGATQYSMAAGTPGLGFIPVDGGLFVQDDWRLKPSLTLSFGLRYELQNYISDWGNLGPRFGFAWAPGTRQGKTGKTVIRGGFGIFYDRVGSDLILSTLRYNGTNQQQYIINNPDFFPKVPTPEQLSGAQPVTVQTFNPNLKAPYLMQVVLGVERQLPRNTTLAVNYAGSRGLHTLRSQVLPGVDNGELGALYQYESDGLMNQSQLIVNVNSRFSKRVSLFSFYVLNNAKNNTDGSGSFPAQTFNLASDYGRASYDVRQRFMLGGSIIAPWNLRFAPFIIARTGSPFNITTGRDNNRDTIYADRPSWATPGEAGAIDTSWGSFNPLPLPGEAIIPRNLGEGPGYFSINLRLSKTFGFGENKSSSASDTGMGGGPPGGGGRGYGGGGGGPRGGFGGGMRGGMGGDVMTNHRYNLTLAISARNLFNTVNLAAPIGNLTSPSFGESIALAGGFGPGGSMANNRRIELQARFSF